MTDANKEILLHLDHASRVINEVWTSLASRGVAVRDRDTVLLRHQRIRELVEAELPDEIPATAFRGNFLHPGGGSRRIGYRNNTFGAPGDPRFNLDEYAQDHSHVLFYPESNDNLTGLLGRPDLTYSFYDDPEAMVPFLERCRALDVHPWPALMDQTDPKYERFEDWSPKLHRALDLWHDELGLVDVVLAGIELDARWPGDTGLFWLTDMCRELHARHPGLRVFVHFLGGFQGGKEIPGYRFIPTADGIFWQAIYESHRRMQQVVQHLVMAARQARQDGYSYFVLAEYAQHPQATESNGEEIHELCSPILDRFGWPITGGCGLS